jgi:hypothetical protein
VKPIDQHHPRLDLYDRACAAVAHSPQSEAIERAAAHRLTSGEPLPTAEQWAAWVASMLAGRQANAQ